MLNYLKVNGGGQFNLDPYKICIKDYTISLLLGILCSLFIVGGNI